MLRAVSHVVLLRCRIIHNQHYAPYEHIYIYIPASVRFFYLFRCVLSSVLPLRSVGRSNFDKGRHNLTTLIHIKTKLYLNMNYIYIITESRQGDVFIINF